MMKLKINIYPALPFTRRESHLRPSLSAPHQLRSGARRLCRGCDYDAACRTDCGLHQGSGRGRHTPGAGHRADVVACPARPSSPGSLCRRPCTAARGLLTLTHTAARLAGEGVVEEEEKQPGMESEAGRPNVTSASVQPNNNLSL